MTSRQFLDGGQPPSYNH